MYRLYVIQKRYRSVEACGAGLRGYVEMGGKYCAEIGGGGRGVLLDKGVHREKE